MTSRSKIIVRPRAPDSRSKVRTGCITCKSRRIKCDEQRPSCLRCIASKRICDGYPVTPQHISSVARILNDEERRSFLYFQTRTAHRIFGQQDVQSWVQILMQLGHAELAVKHIIVALASLHESVEHARDIDFVLTSRKRTRNTAQILALKHYNEAIRYLRTEAFDVSHRPDVVVILCILFVCFEQLRINDVACTIHLTAGLQLLSSWRARTNNYTQLQSFSRPTLELMNDKITPILQRLRVQFALCMDIRHTMRNSGLTPCLPPPNIPASYDTLERARRDFDRAMNYIFSVLEYRSTTGHKGSKEDLITILDPWRQALDACAGQHTPAQICVHKLLTLYYYTSSIIISTYGTDSEMDFDAYTDQFQKVAELAVKLVKHWKATTQQYSLLFSFDLGITPPMFFVASRCRHPQIRRIALDIMLQSPVYHGIWPDWYSGICARRIIEIEEQGLESTNDSMYVPENQRIRKISADLEQESKTIFMRYMYSPFSPDGEILTTSIPLTL